MFHALDETDVEFPRLGFEDAALHRDAGLHQTQQAATGDLGVGILHRRDHPRPPAPTSASAHGGVRPKWLQGSRVT